LLDDPELLGVRHGYLGGMTGTEETLAVNNKEVMYYHYHIVMVSIARI
jgi:hypothetical protein